MSQLNINELYQTINEKTLKRMEVYDTILQKCHHRIKYNSKLERTYCFYQIPTFIFGTPIYDISDMKSYIRNSLQKNGFEIMCIEPNWLFISWNMKGKKHLIENGAKDNTTKKIVKNDYRSVETYKPTGNFIYDESTMMGLSDKLNQ